MKLKIKTVGAKKSLALVAHDNMKQNLLDWCIANSDSLTNHKLYATGTTGHLLRAKTQLDIESLISGPLGGDQQIGAMISDGQINGLIFFWDPFEPLPHDPDVKALLRVAAVWNIPVACNRSSADFIISSPMMQSEYQCKVPDYQQYLDERIGGL